MLGRVRVGRCEAIVELLDTNACLALRNELRRQGEGELVGRRPHGYVMK
jgi:hypothetical protein